MASDVSLTCPECGQPMVLRKTEFRLLWSCSQYPRCNGSGGAHPDGRPLGVPGNLETKQARHRAHQAFDALWRERKLMSRGAAYKWLSDKMGVADAHIGAMNVEECERVIKLCEEFNPLDILALEEVREAKKHVKKRGDRWRAERRKRNRMLAKLRKDCLR